MTPTVTITAAAAAFIHASITCDRTNLGGIFVFPVPSGSLHLTYPDL